MATKGLSEVEPYEPHPPVCPLDPLLTGPGMSRSFASMALTAQGVRNLNINLVTAYPRAIALRAAIGLKPKVAIGVTVVLAIVVVGALLLMFLASWWCWVVAAYFVLIGLVGVALWVPFPSSGTFLQWVKFTGTSNRWSLDVFTAFGASSWVVKAVGGLVLLLPPALALVPCVLIDGVIGELFAALVLGLTLLAGVLLYVAWLDRLGRGLGDDRQRGLPGEINRLTMVHALSWTALKEFPAEGKKRHRPLLFVSSFNEAFDGYVGGFVEGLRGGLEIPWGLSPNFPEVAKGFRPFLEYVERTERELHHSFSAYPHLTTDDIRSALHVDRKVRSFGVQTPAANRQARWPQLLTELQHGLVSLPQPVGFGFDPLTGVAEMVAARVPYRIADTRILIAVVPFERKHTADVVANVLAMPGGKPGIEGLDAARMSPFAGVVGTHLARLSVVDYIHYEVPRRPLPPPVPPYADPSQPSAMGWIVFAAHIDVDVKLDEKAGVDDWLRRTWGQFVASSSTDVWKHCLPSPPTNEQEFADLITGWLVRPITRAVDHPDATVWDVVRAVVTARWFVPVAADPAGWAKLPVPAQPPWEHP